VFLTASGTHFCLVLGLASATCTWGFSFYSDVHVIGDAFLICCDLSTPKEEPIVLTLLCSALDIP
jgi:hypothetical protein